jgi:ADP-ribose pyrophosphatase YjhB (NUDIX family)
MESKWLSHAKQLQAIASTGLHFCKDEFDRERYLQIAEIANTMLCELAVVPLARIEGLVSDFAKGYATPKVDVRGALIEGEKILLVREKSDRLWTLPGGFADVGLSAGENVAKEFMEEAGIRVSPGELYCIRHKAKYEYTQDVRDFYKIFFVCERLDDSVPKCGDETIDVDFFPLDGLPPLSRGRVIEADIQMAFSFKRTSPSRVFFD